MNAARAEIPEYRHNRNFIRKGDRVKCKPVSGTSFIATVTKITRVGDDDSTIEVEVFGGAKTKKHASAAFRTFTPARIERVAQTKNGEKL